jgi:hypothetical protein
MGPRREKVIACERGGTYKYFLAREQVFAIWQVLRDTYGPIRRDDVMKTIEVRGERLLFRSTLLGNPVTVFRLPDCGPEDVMQFHALIGYLDEEPTP